MLFATPKPSLSDLILWGDYWDLSDLLAEIDRLASGSTTQLHRGSGFIEEFSSSVNASRLGHAAHTRTFDAGHTQKTVYGIEHNWIYYFGIIALYRHELAWSSYPRSTHIMVDIMLDTYVNALESKIPTNGYLSSLFLSLPGGPIEPFINRLASRQLYFQSLRTNLRRRSRLLPILSSLTFSYDTLARVKPEILDPHPSVFLPFSDDATD